MSDRPYVITLTRTVAVTPPELYLAWTEPVILARWLAPDVTAHPAPGGVFRCTLADGSALDGAYQALIPGERVTIALRTPGELLEVGMFAVTRDLSELELAVRWGGPPPSPEEVRAREDRWRALLDRLITGVEPAATADPDA